MRIPLKHRLCLFLVAAVLLPANLFGVEVTASVDARSVLVQQPFTLTIEARGGEGMPVVRMPEIDGLATISGPMQSSNYSWVNGKATVSKTVSYTLVPLKPGPLTIPALDVRVDRKVHRTQAIGIMVQQRGDESSSEEGGKRASPLYLQAEPSKRTIYVGEPVTVYFKLYTQVSVFNYQIDAFPDAVGFWSEEVPQDRQPRLKSEIIDGVRYNTAVLKTVVYYPTRSGALEIDAMGAQVEIEVKSDARRRGLFNDPFFNDPFFNGYGRRAQKNLKSAPLKIEVQDLPQPAPAGFRGAVGRFEISARLDTPVVNVGDAVGYHLRLAGRGNFKTLNLPELNLPPSIDALKPEKQEEIKLVSGQYQGFKELTYLLVPRQSGEFKLPEMAFTFFDPQRSMYRTVAPASLSLDVLELGTDAPVVVSGYSREEIEMMAEDIRYIKRPSSHFVGLTSMGRPGGLFWGFHFVGVVVLGGFLYYEHRSRRLAGDPALRRRSRAWRMAMELFEEARRLKESPEACGGLVSRALTGFVGDRLNVAEQALETHELLHLVETNASESLSGELESFLQRLEMNRFMPGQEPLEPDEMIEQGNLLLKRLSKELRS